MASSPGHLCFRAPAPPLATLVLSRCWRLRRVGPWPRQGCMFPGRAGAPLAVLPFSGLGPPHIVTVCGCGVRVPCQHPASLGRCRSEVMGSPRVQRRPGEPVQSPASAHKPPVPTGSSAHQVILPPEGPPTWTRLPRPPSAPSPITTCMPRSRYRIPCLCPAMAGPPRLTPCLPQPRHRAGPRGRLRPG